MKKHMKQFRDILNIIINDSFPNLKKKKIYIFESKFSKLKGMALRPLPWVYLIILNNDVKDKDMEYKTGLMAHEISHLDLYSRISWPRYLYEGLLYITSRKFRSKNEWETEKNAIKKGYVKQVFHYSKERIEFRERYGYMSCESIKEYAASLEQLKS